METSYPIASVSKHFTAAAYHPSGRHLYGARRQRIAVVQMGAEVHARFPVVQDRDQKPRHVDLLLDRAIAVELCRAQQGVEPGRLRAHLVFGTSVATSGHLLLQFK